jgi:hypothetical protein
MSHILVLSCETSGFSKDIDITKTTKGYYQPVAWGLLVVDSDLNVVDKLYVEIKWDAKSLWDKQAVDIHGLSIEYLQKEGKKELEAVTEIGGFIYTYFKGEPIQMMGYNVDFAVSFLNEMFRRYEVQLKFHRKRYDLNTIGFALLNCTNKKEIFSILGIKEPMRNALVTSYSILNCFKRIKKLWAAIM